jgi:diguanylate cyclase (GGDEF)-like protein
MPSFSLDILTLTIMLMAVTAVLSITMILSFLTRKTYPGFGLWTAGNATFTVGFFFVSLRNLIPDIFTVVLANVLLLTAAICFLEGTRLFRGKTIHKIFSVSLIVVYTVFQSYYTFVNNDIGVRIIVISLLMAVIYGLVALELLRNVLPDLRFPYWLTGSLFAFYSIFMFARGLITELIPAPHDLFAPNMLQTITFLLAIFLGIAWTFGFLMLNSERLEFDLKSAQLELERMAKIDFLTGIANNRFFFEAGASEVQRAQRYNRPLAVLMVDLDRFKKINDTYGHAIGDKALVKLAVICKNFLRNGDIFGRLGGEEFAILLPETDITGGGIIAERLLSAIAKTNIEVDNKILHITVSIGVAELLPDEDKLETLLKRADDAMYEAKRKGRNQVIIALS